MNVVVTKPAELGAAVREARREIGVTQEVLAAGAGVGVRFVVELEAGKPTVQLDRVLQVLAALDLHLELTPLPEGGKPGMQPRRASPPR